MKIRFLWLWCVSLMAAAAGGGCASDSGDDGSAGVNNDGCQGCQGPGGGTGGTSAGGTGSCAGCMGGAGSGGTQAGSGGAGGGTGGTQTGSGGSGSGGAPGDGGGGGNAGPCGRPASACTAPGVEVTEIDLGSAIVDYGREGDTLPLPLAIAAMPSGGSRVAALGVDNQVRIGELDCDDNLVGTPFAIPAVDLQDIIADAEGGVVLVTREATNGGQDNCGGGQLCGGESSPCRTMWMVRFDAQGQVQWETQVTNLGPDLAGYDNGARFVWWYQHHGRLAFDGQNYAAYFGVAITVDGANACIDIHQGDRMQVVGPDGTLIANHPDAFQVGCSHAWQSRIVWDPRVSHFVMVCTTDNACRIAQPNPYRTVADGNCDGTLFGGDLVLASDVGYWTAWSQGNQIRLDHFTTGASDRTVANAGPSSHPHLVSYGPDNMLLSWETGQGLTAQVRSAATGDTVGTEFAIAVPDHDFQAFKDFPDGSVAYAAAGSSNTKVRIARVMPCN